MLETFSDKWWDKFLQTTENLTKTSVIENCMSQEETSLLRSYVLEILTYLGELRTNKYGYRVYEEGKKLTDDQMNYLYDSPPQKNDTILTWSQRVFGDKQFGIIINSGERFNLELVKNIALKTEPYLKKIGYPREGANFSIFIGNYNKTPIGVHRDPPGEDVMHFHLGPNDKTMFTWSNELYRDLIRKNKIGEQDLERLLPYATKYTFKEGDMYFMPEGVYHVGQQSGLSIALTFWRYNHTKTMLARKLLDYISSEYVENNGDLLKSDQNDFDDFSGLNETLSLFKIPKEAQDMGYKDLIKIAYQDLRYAIHSNAGYRRSPLEKKEEITFELDNIIQIEKPFKILYKNSLDKDQMEIFVRGVRFYLPNFECIKKLIDKINFGKPTKVLELSKMLDQDWEDDICSYILNQIFINHGIKLINPME